MKKKIQGAFELNIPKQKRKYVEHGYMKDIETKALADRLRNNFRKDGYEVKMNSYVVAHQKWWRLSFKR
jgi:predicted esterase